MAILIVRGTFHLRLVLFNFSRISCALKLTKNYHYLLSTLISISSK